MGGLLAAADSAAGRLTFVVVLPRRPEEAGWRALRGAAHMTCEVVLPRSKHAFVDGGQHYGRRGRRGGGAPPPPPAAPPTRHEA
mmetsp:Transcript_20161/g.51040  ORF Transcript_20161/g.51040 Transcript_20161/m.51040 type:complete len:84 (-) Transcript_20161:1-252(-)